MKRLKLNLLKIITVCILPALMAGCVSVGLPKEPIVRSDRYTYEIPSSTFKKIDPDDSDLAWRNPRTGNTIAVISECSLNKDPELSALEIESTSALSGVKVLSSKSTSYNDRDALLSVAEGTVDGVPVKIQVLNFKKSTCIYSLTYFGRSSGFMVDQPEFEKFMKGFKAQ